MSEFDPIYHRRSNPVKRVSDIVSLTRQLREGFSLAFVIYSIISLHGFNRADIALNQAELAIIPILPEALKAAVDTVRIGWYKIVRHKDMAEISARIEQNWNQNKSITAWAGDLLIGLGTGSFLGGNQMWQADLVNFPFPNSAPASLLSGAALRIWGTKKGRE